MSRPKIKIELDKLDLILEVLGVVFITSMIVVVWYHYYELPETIPIHFNTSGEADGFGSRATLLTLPVIGTITYVGMLFLNKFPQIFNYPTQITEENAESQYRKASKLIRSLNTSTAAMFFYLSYRTVLVSLSEADGLGSYFTYIMILLIMGPIIAYLISVFKKS